ncbi:MAG: TauD/TfdA family dioxygenase [Caulobacteraceae bacterium]|nr:TauD/TfdA family dioxygenase [Caulobacteraceae bacterium]
MGYQIIEVAPLSKRIGAEVSGADLGKPLSAAAVEEIKDALHAHLVIFFRDQPLSPAQQVALGRAFGNLALHTGRDGLEDFPEVITIHADETTRHVNTEGWHSDSSCNRAPPMGSILYMHTVPQSGGDTVFASMYAAYEALSPAMQAILGGLSAAHDGGQAYRRARPDLEKDYPSAIHPVIRTHPVTGRKGVYVNPTFTTKIAGMRRKESEAILSFLYQHMLDPAFHVRFRWRPHSVAFWDNRCTQHRAIFDYYPETRSGFRVDVEGDKPF